MIKYEIGLKSIMQQLFENGHQELVLDKNDDGNYFDAETVRRFETYVEGYNDGRYVLLNTQAEY